MMIRRKSDKEIDLMWKAGRILGSLFTKLESEVVEPGISTREIDEIICGFIESRGAYPAFKGYNGFPGCSCISIDDEVVHGIPGDRVLEEGQIVSIDIGAKLDGFFSDAARTYPVGSISSEKKILLDVTRKALMAGIEMAKEGNRLHDISHAVQTVAEDAGFSVVRSLVGHGIGTELHEAPEIPNYGKPGTGPRLKEGMVFAIEPMVNIGEYYVVTKDDDWTIVTSDGSPSAHFENTVAITEGTPRILTLEV